MEWGWEVLIINLKGGNGYGWKLSHSGQETQGGVIGIFEPQKKH